MVFRGTQEDQLLLVECTAGGGWVGNSHLTANEGVS